MSVQDGIFIIEKPMPFIPENNPVGIAALQSQISKGLKKLPGFAPLYAQGSLNVNVKRYCTDANGTVVNKATLPANMKFAYPIFVLGNFDRVGGYNIGNKIVKIPAGAVFLMTYVHGNSTPFLYNSGFNDVSQNFKIGDIITVYTDSLSTPNFYVFIVQTCDYGSLASIISNTQTQQQDGVIGKIQVKNIAYQVDNDDQLNQVWQMMAFDNLGQFKQTPFNPIIYKQPLYKLTDFIELPVSFLFTQFTGIYTLFSFTSESVNINIRMAK